MARQAPPTRTLREHPDLEQLKRQAKELLESFRAGNPAAVQEIHTHYRQADAATFALHDAQLVLARAHGFDSWPKLKAFVDGVTVRRLVDAVRAGDLDAVTSMVAARPELVHLDVAENDEHRALHHAVLQRQPEIVLFLMQHGADARKGIWPHRDATTAFTLASDRGYSDIAAIIREEEQRRSGDATPLKTLPPQVAAGLVEAFQRGDEDAMIATLAAHPQLIRLSEPSGRTALHWAAACLWPRITAWLLDHGADPNAREKNGNTPLDVLGEEPIDSASLDNARLAKDIAEMLLARGATRTAHSAIATGDADWLRARHADGTLSTFSRLLTQAVNANRPDMLTLLLDLGLDPDERGRVDGLEEIVPTWGEPLRECAMQGKLDMAEILLAHGANPNTNVYAATTALHEAYRREDVAMMALLERHGGRLAPVFIGILGLVDQAATFLAAYSTRPRPDVPEVPGASIGELLWGAIESPSPEIVRITLPHIDWPRDDPRWHWVLENGLYLCPDSDRPRYLEAFRLVLDRADPSVRGRRGCTLLHDIAASRGRFASLTADDRVTYATLLLDRGARLDLRDDLLLSTPLGWACRWGRVELVKLLLERGADPVEPGAEPWTTPKAWAEKRSDLKMIALLDGY